MDKEKNNQLVEECEEEQLLNVVSKEPSEESLKGVAKREKLLRELGDSVSADANKGYNIPVFSLVVYEESRVM